MAVSVNLANVDGKRVRVTVVGIAHSARDYGGAFWSLGGYEPFYLPSPKVVSMEVLPDPLKVGTEIRGESPIPIPIGTVLRGANGVVMEKSQFGWLSPGSEHAVVENPNPKGPPEIFPLTVLYVPGET